MCGFLYNVTELPLLEPLLDIAGYDEDEISDIIQRDQLRPTDTVINLVPTRSGPRLMGATWWLATNADGSLNTKLATFNSKAEKLLTSPLHLGKPKSIRSVVVAQGFCEWQPLYKGGLTFSQLPVDAEDAKKLKPERKVRHLIQMKDTPIMLLGAVSKLRLNAIGKPVINTSVITLPPHADFADIHAKSFPLVLNINELVDWLDPAVPLTKFSKLLAQTTFRQYFSALPVDKDLQPIGKAIHLSPLKD